MDATGFSTLVSWILSRSIIVTLLLVTAVTQSAWAVNPKSPEVTKLIDKGFEFLETGRDGRLGGKCLIGMTYLKAGRPATHWQVKEAVEACQQQAKGDPAQDSEDVYSLGIAVMFLCELDPSKYSKEIEYFLAVLKLRQKAHGGWGYTAQHTGDTSMTQYGVLSAWTARDAGFVVSDDSLERVTNWLIRTQDPSGGWGYQGNDPGNYTRVPQSEVRLSLTTAALGSSLIAGKLLGVIDMSDEGDDEGLPPALIPVQEKQPDNPNLNQNIDPARLRAAIGLGNNWFRQNFTIKPGGFTHYYLYALERFMSFKELAEGRRVPEPEWYNEGYKYLKETQDPTGSWRSEGGYAVDTSFAILFLLRSTKKAIEKSKTFGAGTLVGGRGLPSNTAGVKLRGGRVVAKNQAQAVEDMLKALGDPDEIELEQLAENPEEIELSDDQQIRHQQLKDLRQVVRGGSSKARLAAVRALGKSRDPAYVPLLIYAITDPDPKVAVAADQALRMMSRKLDGVAMRIPPDKADREQAVARWKSWFTRIYPDMALEE